MLHTVVSKIAAMKGGIQNIQGWKMVLASQVGAVWDLLLGYMVGHLTWGKDVSKSSKRKILSKASLGFKIPGGI